MKIISFDDIANLSLDTEDIYAWIKKSFENKAEACLPPKISMHNGSTFINVMPCILYNENVAGVKVVSRYQMGMPRLNSEILLYDCSTGNRKR